MKRYQKPADMIEFKQIFKYSWKLVFQITDTWQLHKNGDYWPTMTARNMSLLYKEKQTCLCDGHQMYITGLQPCDGRNVNHRFKVRSVYRPEIGEKIFNPCLHIKVHIMWHTQNCNISWILVLGGKIICSYS